MSKHKLISIIKSIIRILSLLICIVGYLYHNLLIVVSGFVGLTLAELLGIYEEEYEK